MDEKELQELKLEEIIKEFHQDPEEMEDFSEEEALETEVWNILEESLQQPETVPAEPPEPPVPEPDAEEFLSDKIDWTATVEVSEEESVRIDIPDETLSQSVTEMLPDEPEADEQLRTDLPTGQKKDDTIRLEVPVQEVTSDTIRLDALTGKLPKAKVRKAVPVDEDITRRIEIPASAKEEPFSDTWEPEYEQPMGEYIPPQPIVFRPVSRLRELKRQLVAGPEKRFYELSETGLGKLQVAIFFSLVVVLISAGVTVMYAFGLVQENRIRLMVFGQFFAMLLSGLLGVNQMLEGASDVFHRRFTLNTLLVITFLACCLDGVLCLKRLRVPCCAAFCLQVTMSLLHTYEARKTEMGQMDTLRKANHLEGMAICQDYYEGKSGLMRSEGQVEEFMDTYGAPSKHEIILQRYGLIALAGSVAVAVVAGVMHGVFAAVQVLTVSLLASLPATAFIAVSRPFAVLEHRLHGLGTVLCGWEGIDKLSGNLMFPVSHEDLYPAGSARLNGVKFYGSRQPDEIVAYCTAVVVADGGGLAPVFTQVLDSRNGYHYDAENLRIYDGGIGAEVRGEPVLVGPQSFLSQMGVEVPEGIRVSNAVCISIDGEFSGLFAVTYDKVRSSVAGMATLCGYRGLEPVLTSSDFVLTPQFLQGKFGIKLRKILIPTHEVRRQLREKTLEAGSPSLLLTTREGLAPTAYGVTGARALHTAAKLGVAIHMVGGILGLAMMLVLVILGALDLLTPANMLMYQLVWMIPGFLITEWTRTV